MIRLHSKTHALTLEVTPQGDLLEKRMPLSQPNRIKTASIPRTTFAPELPETRAQALVERYAAQGYAVVQSELRPTWMLRVSDDQPDRLREKVIRILHTCDESWDGEGILPRTFLQLVTRGSQLRLLAKLPEPAADRFDRPFDLPLLIAACLHQPCELLMPDGVPDLLGPRLYVRRPLWTEVEREPLYHYGVLNRPFAASRFRSVSTRHHAAF